MGEGAGGARTGSRQAEVEGRGRKQDRGHPDLQSQAWTSFSPPGHGRGTISECGVRMGLPGPWGVEGQEGWGADITTLWPPGFRVFGGGRAVLWGVRAEGLPHARRRGGPGKRRSQPSTRQLPSRLLGLRESHRLTLPCLSAQRDLGQQPGQLHRVPLPGRARGARADPQAVALPRRVQLQGVCPRGTGQPGGLLAWPGRPCPHPLLEPLHALL